MSDQPERPEQEPELTEEEAAELLAALKQVVIEEICEPLREIGQMLDAIADKLADTGECIDERHRKLMERTEEARVEILARMDETLGRLEPDPDNRQPESKIRKPS